jgi:hypothetical protein
MTHLCFFSRGCLIDESVLFVVVKSTVVSMPKASSRLTKKHVLLATVVVLTVGLVITGVLVAVRLITDTQKEIVKV